MEHGQKKIWLRRLPLISVLIFGLLSFYLFGEYFTLENLQNNHRAIFDIKHSYPLLSALFYIVFYAVATTLSLPFGTVLAILGGYLFGTYIGLAVVTTGATIGATSIFLISRYSLKGVIPKPLEKIYNKVKNNFEEDEVSYLMFLRLVPLFPFAVVNILPALFKVPLRVYILTTFFGIIPGTFAHTYLGSAFEEVQTLSGIISPKVINGFVLLGLLALLPIVFKKLKSKKI
tara:strand:+ start:67088 stop:67780 length:693 start_codon:yes stop_codon:yes gene_type:complete